jgi:hypothetical protein
METMTRARRKEVRAGGGGRRWPPTKARLKELVTDALVDAYDESEQRTGLFTMIEENLALPFETDVLGLTVAVE